MIAVNKELLNRIVETEDAVEKLELMTELKNDILTGNNLNELVEFVAECLVHRFATPKIPISQSQYEALMTLFKIKGIDGRGGDRRSKKFQKSQL